MMETFNSLRMEVFVLFAMAVFFAYAEGWQSLNPSRRMPRPAKGFRRTPFAKGRVTVEDGALRVEKTNFGGMVVVLPRKSTGR